MTAKDHQSAYPSQLKEKDRVDRSNRLLIIEPVAAEHGLYTTEFDWIWNATQAICHACENHTPLE
jgi:hypothetical protein